METIARKFSEGPFVYEQVERQGMWAIYTQSHKASGVVRYELVHLHVQKAHVWPDGAQTPEREAYPPSSQWGQRGLTFFTLAAAKKAFFQHDQVLEGVIP